MGTEARNEDLDLTAEEKEKFSELVALLAKHGFGAAGPPRETSFAQMERFGHQAGQMLARAIDARLAGQHAAHFAGEEPCPTCGEQHLPKESPHELGLAVSNLKCNTLGR
jgi:DNA repair exonuclease SbcCD ATPase subunit